MSISNTTSPPDWLKPEEYLSVARSADVADARQALSSSHANEQAFAALISDAAAELLEPMAQRAQALTRRHFGRTIALYAPLYLSSYCNGGCVYCGFASDRDTPRSKLELDQVATELDALHAMGIRDVLLLTGERCSQADVDYIASAVELAAARFPSVAIECFAMESAEYAELVNRGCIGVTLYQETYDRESYEQLHRWGAKSDYLERLNAPDRALSAGIRKFGIGPLFGLSDPHYDAIALFQHARYLQKRYWRSGISISFPRICPEPGAFEARYPITDNWFVQLILAFRICMPDVPLVLSTRESCAFRDGMAGLGINRMSVASRTTVGGYTTRPPTQDPRQFAISDEREIPEFCEMLRSHNLEPVFKNWDAVYR